jgi:hypothetical protein
MGQLVCRWSKAFAEFGQVLGRHVVADCLQERQVWERQVCLAAGSGPADAVEPPSAHPQFRDKARLPHPSLPAEDHHATIASEGFEERVFEDRELSVTPDQIRAQHAGKSHN